MSTEGPSSAKASHVAKAMWDRPEGRPSSAKVTEGRTEGRRGTMIGEVP